jgi:O-antigen/teichoic acid export membrane protein
MAFVGGSLVFGVNGVLLAAIALPFSTLSSLGQFWAVRERKFLLMGASTAAQSAAFLVTLYPLSYLPGSEGLNPLVAAYTISVATSALVVGRLVARMVAAAAALLWRSRRFIKWILGRYWRYPGWWMPYSLVQMAYGSAPLLALSTYHGAADASYFSIAYKLTFVPFTVIPAAIARVFFKELAGDWPHVQHWSRVLQAVFVASVVVHLPVAVGVIFYGKDLVEAIYGQAWSEVGTFAAITVGPNLLMAVLAGWDRFYDVCRAQRDALAISLVVLAICGLLLGAAILSGAGASTTVMLWAGCQALLAGLWYARLVSLMRSTAAYGPIAATLAGVAVLIVGVPVLLMRSIEGQSGSVQITVFAAAALCYAGGVFWAAGRFWRAYRTES